MAHTDEYEMRMASKRIVIVSGRAQLGQDISLRQLHELSGRGHRLMAK